MKELFTAINNPNENGKTIFQVRFTTDDPQAYDAALTSARQILDGKDDTEALTKWLQNEKLTTREGKIAYICSPYRGDTARNIKYAQQLVLYAISRGWAPICPHLYLPQIFDDSKPEEREAALHVGLELLRGCDVILVGKLYGISEGMEAEINEAKALGKLVRYIE